MKAAGSSQTLGDYLKQRPMFGATLIVGLCTFGVKLVAMLKDMAVAAAFGRGDTLDCFFLAFAVTSFVLNLLAGSCTPALVPAYLHETRTSSETAAQRLLSKMLAIVLGMLAAAAVLLLLCGGAVVQVLGGGFPAAKLEEAARLLRLLTPALLFGGIGMVAASMLNARGLFALAATTPGLQAAITLAGLAAVGPRGGADLLVLGVVAGTALEAALLAWRLHRSGASLMPAWPSSDAPLSNCLRQYWMIMGGSFVIGNTSLIDNVMAAWLPAGSVSALNYGSKVVAVILTLGASAVGTAALPFFSELAARGDHAGMRHTLMVYRRRILAIGLPLAAGVFFWSREIVALLYQRGAFTAIDARVVATVQAFYVLQVPFFLTGLMSSRMLASLGRNQVLFRLSVAALAVNVSLNVAFSAVFGVAGIALSTSVVYLSADLALLWCLRDVGRGGPESQRSRASRTNPHSSSVS